MGSDINAFSDNDGISTTSTDECHGLVLAGLFCHGSVPAQIMYLEGLVSSPSARDGFNFSKACVKTLICGMSRVCQCCIRANKVDEQLTVILKRIPGHEAKAITDYYGFFKRKYNREPRSELAQKVCKKLLRMNASTTNAVDLVQSVHVPC